MGRLTQDKFIEEGYVDVTGNVPLEKLIREIEGIEAIHSPKEVIIRYDPKYDKATIYLTNQDFRKKINTPKANRYLAKLLEKI